MPPNYPSSSFKVQENKTTNQPELTDISRAPNSGRLLCLDLGTRKIGIAVSDEIQITVRPIEVMKSPGWKKLLKKICEVIVRYDAAALVIGLPLGFEGGESDMSAEARRIAGNFSKSLEIPVFLHDERMSTYVARGHLWKLGKDDDEIRERLDAEAAAVILSDFIETRNALLGRTE